MTVYRDKRRNDVWVYDFWRRKKRYFDYCRDPQTGALVKTKTQAEAVEIAKKAEVDATPDNAGRSDTSAEHYCILQAAATHIGRLVDKKRNAKHIANNRQYVAEIVTVLGAATAFADLLQEDVNRFIRYAYAQTTKKWLGSRRPKTEEDYLNPNLWKDTGRPRTIRTANNYVRCLMTLCKRASKIRDPRTKRAAIDLSHLEFDLERPPKRKPRPMADQEISDRFDKLMPWTQDATLLSRLFGLRLSEALWVEERHVDPYRRCLAFKGEETKSGADEVAYGGAEGWKLLLRLRRQARRRKTTYLITWPGAEWVHVVMAGKPAKPKAWLPLRSLGSSWRKSGRRAKIAQPGRFHDVRARFITEVAKTDRSAAQGAARHLTAATTEIYIGVADDEVAKAVESANKIKAGSPLLRLVRAA